MDAITYHKQRRQNLHNTHQRYDEYPRVLVVCLGGMLRSPTIAWVLSNEPYGCNTRAAGVVPEYSPVALDHHLIDWADVIVCADGYHFKFINEEMEKLGIQKPVYCLQVEDRHEYRSPELVKLVHSRLKAVNFEAGLAKVRKENTAKVREARAAALAELAKMSARGDLQ